MSWEKNGDISVSGLGSETALSDQDPDATATHVLLGCAPPGAGDNVLPFCCVQPNKMDVALQTCGEYKQWIATLHFLGLASIGLLHICMFLC